MFFQAVDVTQLPTGAEEGSAIKTHVPTFQTGLQWESLKPTIESAGIIYLESVLGEDFYAELIEKYGAWSSATDEEKELIRRLQKALAFYSWHESTKELITTLSDLGTKETTDTHQTAAPPRQWVYKQALLNSFQKGNRFLDRALSYLEKQKAEFETWTDSEEYKESKALFFSSGEELNKFLPCDSSRVVYCQLRPFIKEAERRYILPVLGAPFLAELKTAILDSSESDEQKEAIEKIREALVKWVQVCAIPNLRLKINRDGLLEVTFNQNEIFQQERPREETIRSLWINLTQAGELFLIDLKNFLLTNSANYPTWEADQVESDSTFSGFITSGEDDEPRTVYGFI